MHNKLFDYFIEYPKNEPKLLEVFKDLIKKGTSLDTTDEEGELLLHHACNQGYSQLAHLLINNTTDIDRQSNVGITPMHYAAANGLITVCQALINKGADVTKKTSDGLTPLYLAMEYSTEDMAACLASACTDLSTPIGDYGRTLLHLAAIKGYEQLCTISLDKDVPVDITDTQGYTALQLAVRENHLNLIEYLVKRGASLTHVNQTGLSASSIASGKIAILRLLQKLGDPYITDDWFPAKINLPLPVFRYHPDPIATGSIIPDEDFICACCDKLAGYYIIVGDEDFCPWCVASGKAYRKFKTQFTEQACLFETKLPKDVQNEITQRTPGFYGWQEEQWLTCCNDACAYLGKGGLKELSTFGDSAIIAIKQAIAEYGLNNVDVDKYLSELSHAHGPSAYLFQCLSCKQFKAYIDTD